MNVLRPGTWISTSKTTPICKSIHHHEIMLHPLLSINYDGKKVEIKLYKYEETMKLQKQKETSDINIFKGILKRSLYKYKEHEYNWVDNNCIHYASYCWNEQRKFIIKPFKIEKQIIGDLLLNDIDETELHKQAQILKRYVEIVMWKYPPSTSEFEEGWKIYHWPYFYKHSAPFLQSNDE
eukprot:168442_1